MLGELFLSTQAMFLVLNGWNLYRGYRPPLDREKVLGGVDSILYVIRIRTLYDFAFSTLCIDHTPLGRNAYIK